MKTLFEQDPALAGWIYGKSSTIQSGRYRVVFYNSDHAIIRRLSDWKASDVCESRFSILKGALAAIEPIDAGRLGSKPSVEYCRAFDLICGGYFS
jgi:hypothetical protein